MGKTTNTDDCPSCFGDAKKTGVLEDCSTCPYTESCKFYAENPAPSRYGRDSKGHHVSVEAYAYSEEISEIPAPDESDEEEKEAEFNRPVYSNADMQKLLEFFLRGIDDYSLAIIECVMRENMTSAAQVAKAFGVSREAMHRKLIDACLMYPYLRDTLRCALHRCKALADPENRSTIAGRRMRQQNDVKSDPERERKQQEQMEFTFNA